MTSRGRPCFVAALLVTMTVGAATTSDAQSRSTLTGTIKGSDGAVVAGATVTLEGSSLQGGAQVSLTNARGVYRFSLLAPGVYDLAATFQGWQTARRAGVRLSVGTTLTVDLVVGNAAPVEVARTEGSGPVVDVTTATSATNLTNEDLDNLPAVGLLQLGPGVTPRAVFGSGSDTSPLTTPIFDLMNTSDLTTQITMRVLANGNLQEINRSTIGNVGIDDDLAHAYTDEYVVGVERAIVPDASLTVQYVRRNVDRIWARINTTSQYAPVQRRDPGQDGQLGTSDDGELITVFNLLNPGAGFQVLTNPDGAFRRYDAVQVIGQKRYARNWQLLAAYTWSSTRGTVGTSNGDNRASGPDTGNNGVFVSPNRHHQRRGAECLRLCAPAERPGHLFLPGLGVAVSGGYRYLSGSPWGRMAVITGLQQGNTAVRIEPRGTRRTEAGSSIDARIQKTFTLGRSGRTVGVYTDVLNLTNQGVPLALSVVDASGAAFGEPTAWAQSRRASIAVRAKF